MSSSSRRKVRGGGLEGRGTGTGALPTYLAHESQGRALLPVMYTACQDQQPVGGLAPLPTFLPDGGVAGGRRADERRPADGGLVTFAECVNGDGRNWHLTCCTDCREHLHLVPAYLVHPCLSAPMPRCTLKDEQTN